jgi:SAM-dependent methyltransferase
VCNASCIAFARAQLSPDEVSGKAVLEVGAFDVNGTVRPVVEALGPATYIGVDIEQGPGVDALCDVTALRERYGESVFDVVLATELVEHVRDWRSAFANMKRVLVPGGTIMITTRSRGFPIHGYPSDYWRYEPGDMERIFADFEILAIERDPETPGVFIKARRPHDSLPVAQLDDIELFSVVSGRRTRDISPWEDLVSRLRFGPARVWGRSQSLRNKLAFRTRLRQLRHRDTS